MALVNDAGRMKGRCTFLTKVETQTSRGTTKIVEKDLFTCWYAPATMYIRDVQEITGNGHSIKKTIMIRSIQRHEINNNMKVRIKNRVYEIEQIIRDDENLEFDTIVLKDVF